jgi:hypothetical protein
MTQRYEYLLLAIQERDQVTALLGAGVLVVIMIGILIERRASQNIKTAFGAFVVSLWVGLLLSFGFLKG